MQGNDPRWPYLSPSRDGWTWVAGPRGHLRRLLTTETGPAALNADRTAVVLDVLERLDSLMRTMDDDALLLVTEAYSRGASWADIAHRLGRTKQTVHQRYQARVHAKQTEKLLLDDLAQAEQRARYLYHHGSGSDEISRAKAFLQQTVAPHQLRDAS